MATGQVGEISVEGLNLQARFEQLEGAISEAHGIVDQMMPRAEEAGADPKQPDANTAINTATRCSEHLSRLLGRLTNLSERVGRVT